MAFLEFYKKGQGTLARMIALFSAIALAGWGGFSLWKLMRRWDWATGEILTVPHLDFRIDAALIIAVLVALGLIAAAVWVLNRPRSVDLLAETEGEMRKVSWPSRQEAWNSSVVVVFTVLFLMALLFFYDVALNFILRLLFFREPAEAAGVAEGAQGLFAGILSLLTGVLGGGA